MAARALRGDGDPNARAPRLSRLRKLTNELAVRFISAEGRLQKFGVPELLNGIGGIADADFVGLAAAVGEYCEAEDYLIKLQSRELGTSFHVPEPDGVATGA